MMVCLIARVNADSIKSSLGATTCPIVLEHVDDVITASEDEIAEAMKFTMERTKQVALQLVVWTVVVRSVDSDGVDSDGVDSGCVDSGCVCSVDSGCVDTGCV